MIMIFRLGSGNPNGIDFTFYAALINAIFTWRYRNRESAGGCQETEPIFFDFSGDRCLQIQSNSLTTKEKFISTP